MTNKINYQKVLHNTLENLKNKQIKPKLLLHVCCGPCLTIPLEIIKNYFEITLFFNNSNIYPKEEYERRLSELQRYLEESHNENIKLVTADYKPDEFLEYLAPYKDLKEGYERCRVCFRKRLGEGFQYAANNGFEYFGTVMTISRYKNAKDINLTGENLQEKYPTIKWLYADFKKENGYENSLEICRNYNLYFQEYCGCKYSFLKKISK